MVPLLVVALTAAGLDLPQLETSRRRVLNSVRRAGHQVRQISSYEIISQGAVNDFPEAKGVRFFFDGLQLSSFDVLFPKSDVEAQHQRYRNLEISLSRKYGTKWSSREDVASLFVEPGSKTPALGAVTWNNFHERITLRETSDQALIITVRASENQETAEVGTEGDTQQRASLVTETKKATEQILYDLGNQAFISQAARSKGTPLTVRLAKVKLPRGLEGLDPELIERKFVEFAEGHWDLERTDSKRAADLNLVISFAPASTEDGQAVSIELQALSRGTRTNRKPKVVYERTKLATPVAALRP